MARVFRQTYTKPVPDGAQIITGKGRWNARFKESQGRTRVAPLSADGTKTIGETSR